MTVKSKLLVLPVSGLYKEIFAPEVDAQLHMLVDVTLNPEDRNINSSELSQIIGDYDAVLTGWGSPQFTGEVLDAAERLQLVAHSAGSIIQLLPHQVFDRGINVTHAAGAIAPAVAEMTILLILLCLRRAHKFDSLLRAGEAWPQKGDKSLILGQELAGCRIGVVGAGHVGRSVIDKLHAFNADVWVYDPYLSDEWLTRLNASKVELEQIFTDCPVVTIHAPLTTETYHMIGASQLSLLRDGAFFINTARSSIVDETALLAELQTGRIQGALDVFDDEPLSEDSPFRRLDNLIITPHIAGHSVQARHRQGLYMLEEIRRFFNGEPLRYQVTKDMLDIMA